MVCRIVWFSLLGTLGVYLLVAKLVEEKLRPVENVPFDLLKSILFGITIVIFLAAYFVRKALIGAKITARLLHS